ncbi:MAG: TRAP transporter substrate-binding protein [Lachnospiraceae bacterium]|nr:TRAP transporter substrate-binding protein [Lachnospiraceae bacterium]
MKKKILSLMLCAALCVGLLPACSSSASSSSDSGSTTAAAASESEAADDTASDSGDTGATTATYSISANATEGTVTAYICQQFDEMLQESTGGNMSGNVYLNGSLGNDTEVAEQVMSGQVEFLCTNSANLVTMMSELAVLDMPGILTSLEQARATMDDEDFRAALDEVFESNGLKLLMLSDQGFRQTSSNKELREVEDFSGLAIRTMENSIHMAYWESLGANPTPMNRSEVFISLQQGLLEAQEDPYCSIEANNYAEVQEYIIETNHIFSNIIFICNLDYYNSLSEENRTAMEDVCSELLEDSRTYCDQVNEEALTALQEEGMEYIQLEESVLEEISEITYEAVAPLVSEEAGEEMVNLFMAAAGVSE